MNGLIIKDLMVFRKNFKPTGLIGTIILLAFLLYQRSDIGLLIANLIILPVSGSSYSTMLSYYDLQWKWEKYMISMPVTAAEIVKSRIASSYIIFLIYAAAIQVFNIAFCITHNGFGIQMYLFIIAAGLVLSLVMVSVLTAVSYTSTGNANRNSSVGLFCLIILGIALTYILNNLRVDVNTLLSLNKLFILIIISTIALVVIFTANRVSIVSYKRALRRR